MEPTCSIVVVNGVSTKRGSRNGSYGRYVGPITLRNLNEFS